MNRSEDRIQLSGLVDGELRGALTRFEAPARLHRRIRNALHAQSEAPRAAWWSRIRWAAFAPAAGMAFAVLFGANVVIFASLPSHEDQLADEVLTSHVRAMVASHVVDVVSSDRHTVKPWYAGKLDFSPTVVDFAEYGFPLTGGRLDYVNGRTVAALVYERGGHEIDVFTWPAADGANERPASLSRRGYNVMHASHGGMAYWIASDLEVAELARLEKLIARVHAS